MTELRFDTADMADIAHHLRNCDAAFVPPLSTRVDLDVYAAKLATHATTIELWQGAVLAGLLAYYVDERGRCAFVTSVSTLPGLQGQRLGQRLIEELLARLDGRVGAVRLEVDDGNFRARRLYAGNGFTDTVQTGSTITMERIMKP